MADNVIINPGSGGETIATDDVGGVQYQRIKLDVGGDGLALPIANGLPAVPVGALGSLAIDESNATITTTTWFQVPCSGYSWAYLYAAGSGSAYSLMWQISRDGGSTWRRPTNASYTHANWTGQDGNWSVNDNFGGNGFPLGAMFGLLGATHVRVGGPTHTVTTTLVRLWLYTGQPPFIVTGTVLANTRAGSSTQNGAYDEAGGYRIAGAAIRGSSELGLNSDSTWCGVTIADTRGRQIILPYQIPNLTQRAMLAGITDTSAQQAFAPITNIRHYTTQITVANNASSSNRVLLLDGSAAIWACRVPANETVSATFPVALRGSVNTALNVQCGVAGDVDVTVSGYRSGA